MSEKVLSASVESNQVRVFAHCAASNYPAGDVTILVINPNVSKSVTVTFGNAVSGTMRDEFVITADSIQSAIVKLNGAPLQAKGSTLPAMVPHQTAATDSLVLPPTSYAFVVIQANANACK